MAKYIVIAKVADSTSADIMSSRRGDVVQVIPVEKARAIWDQMLANGKVRQADYDAAENADGTMQWPFSPREKRRFFAAVMDLTTRQHDDMTRRHVDAQGEPLTKYPATLDFSALGLTAQERDIVDDVDQEHEPRYDQTVSAAAATRKTIANSTNSVSVIR